LEVEIPVIAPEIRGHFLKALRRLGVGDGKHSFQTLFSLRLPTRRSGDEAGNHESKGIGAHNGVHSSGTIDGVPRASVHVLM